LLVIPGYLTDVIGAVAVFGVMAIHQFVLKNRPVSPVSRAP
jgi:UPF0716 family protein affecting phage T7 exclusion